MELLTHRVIGQHVVVEFVAAGSKNHATASFDSLFLTVDFHPNTENFIVLRDQLQAACVVNNGNFTDGFNSVAVVVEEHVAATSLLSFRSAETPLINCVRFRNVLEAGVTVDINLLIGSQRKEEVFGLHSFVNESFKQFLVFLRVSKVVSLCKVSNSAFAVVRDHHAAGGNSCVAAALSCFFKDDDICTGIFGCNSSGSACTAVTENNDVRFTVPFCGKIGLRFCGSLRDNSPGSGCRKKALEERAFCDLHLSSPIVGFELLVFRNRQEHFCPFHYLGILRLIKLSSFSSLSSFTDLYFL